MLFRTLIEWLEFGGVPPAFLLVPDPILAGALLTFKIIVDPIILALKFSAQYQLLKKYYFDLHPESASYPSIAAGHRNVLGLSEHGIFAINEMMRQGMMIDVDHASEKSVNDILAIASSADHDYPVNSGHNGLRGSRDDNEKTRTREQLTTISNLGGMFGMGWENQTPNQFGNLYSTHLNVMGGKNTAFGSDIDGYAATTKKPTDSRKFVNYTDRTRGDLLTKSSMAGTTRTWDYNLEGMAHIGLYPDFFEALKKDGLNISTINQLFLSAEYFVRMWEKCERRAPLIPR
jgi:microsomal dipeptidase-like Zn-dependent dipeptidase